MLETCKGSDLVGRRYVPPFPYYYGLHGETKGKLAGGGEQAIAWRVVPADFVTTESGTGIVHQAPAFGEVDYDVLVAEQARFVEGVKAHCSSTPSTRPANSPTKAPTTARAAG